MRFASVYQEFSDVDEFRRVISELEKRSDGEELSAGRGSVSNPTGGEEEVDGQRARSQGGYQDERQ